MVFTVRTSYGRVFRFCSPFGVWAVVSTCISLPPLSSLRTSFVVIAVPLKSRVVSITRLEPSHFAVDLTVVAPPRPIIWFVLSEPSSL